jgi:hypothetical protein
MGDTELIAKLEHSIRNVEISLEVAYRRIETLTEAISMILVKSYTKDGATSEEMEVIRRVAHIALAKERHVQRGNLGGRK